MAMDIKQVSYTYSQAIAESGQPGYTLDCFVSVDGVVVVDRHETFNTKEEFFEGIGELIPVIEGGENDD